MIVTKKSLARRTVLRGLGSVIALPLLDGMVPALTPLRLTAASPVRRLGAVYAPNGMNIGQWTPGTEGQGFALTPILTPFAPVRDKIVVVSGLSNKQIADGLPSEGGAGDHSRGQATYLTGVRPKRTEGADLRAGVSVDQIAAQELGKQTQLASLEISLESADLLGSCDFGYACAYTAALSWRTATSPLLMETDPRAVFERLFGDAETTDSKARMTRLQKRKSILDSVSADVTRLQTALDPADRAKLSEYLDAVQDIERRLVKAEQQSALELPVVDRPAGAPAAYADYAELMFDLIALAYQSDLTRVFSFLMGREQSIRTYPEIGVPEGHHQISHHQDRPELLEKLAKINVFHSHIFSKFLQKLQATPDGDGSVLDHTMILYGSGLSNPNLHQHDDLPLMVAGGGAGTIKGNRHIRVAAGTPMANLHLTLLDKMGLRVDRFGESTGLIESLGA
jgi:hypothetical protein